MSTDKLTPDQIADAVHRIMSEPNPFTGTDGYDEMIRRALDGPVPPMKSGGVDRMSDEPKPYDYQGLMLKPGDPVGWMDAEGRVHVESFGVTDKHGGPPPAEIFDTLIRTVEELAGGSTP